MDNTAKSKLINMIGLAELIIVIAAMSIGLLKGYMDNSQANILAGIGLLVFWVISDLVEPFACGRMQDLTFGMKEAYVKYIALDFIGYVGIFYFLTGVGGSGKNSGILGAAVYAVTMKPKRDNMMIFKGEGPQEEDEAAEVDAIQAEEVTQEEE